MADLGLIEGYYGKPWSWEERADTIAFLAPHGYRFYIYAPKADIYLRRLWREPHPREDAEQLTTLSKRARAAGVAFGVGLSPTKLQYGFTADAKESLGRKIDELQQFGIDHLGLLFDDMKGDVPDLAPRQVEVIHWVAERMGSTRLIVCPSYYTDDPILDKVFGARPEGYVEHLGENIDPSIEIFWTGEEVCSREVSVGHLTRVAETLRRKPFLWDNYPVNDGERMSQFLHLRGFTGRRAGIGDLLSTHGINPALQPVLSRIPALTLVDCYRLGDDYEYGASFLLAAQRVLGEDLAAQVYEDVLQLQDIGLDRLGDKAEKLRARYEQSDHAGAKEIVAWLNGAYRITDEIIQAQAGE